MCNYMQTAPQEKEEMVVHKHSTFVVKAQQHTKRLLDTEDVEKRHMDTTTVHLFLYQTK